MDDNGPNEREVRDGDTNDRTSSSIASRSKRRRWPYILFGVVILLPALTLAVWTTIALSWSYSRGERAGFIQKFSQKGWVCKTWEGEIAMVNMPGAAQERFAFSVRDDSVASQITHLMGSRVALVYEQHKGLPGSCFGETEYFVTAVKAVQ
jgi:hypothetical protein